MCKFKLLVWILTKLICVITPISKIDNQRQWECDLEKFKIMYWKTVVEETRRCKRIVFMVYIINAFHFILNRNKSLHRFSFSGYQCSSHQRQFSTHMRTCFERQRQLSQKSTAQVCRNPNSNSPNLTSFVCFPLNFNSFLLVLCILKILVGRHYTIFMEITWNRLVETQIQQTEKKTLFLYDVFWIFLFLNRLCLFVCI